MTSLTSNLQIGKLEGNGNPLQYSCLENPMDGGAWWATLVHGVAAKSRTRRSDFTFHFQSQRSEGSLLHPCPTSAVPPHSARVILYNVNQNMLFPCESVSITSHLWPAELVPKDSPAW